MFTFLGMGVIDAFSCVLLSSQAITLASREKMKKMGGIEKENCQNSPG